MLEDTQVLEAVLKVVSKIVNDKYARQSINKLPEQYTIRLEELQNAFREAYVYFHNEAVKAGDPSWPNPEDPNYGYIMKQGFLDAGQAAYDWVNNVVDANTYKRVSRGANTGHSPIVLLLRQGVYTPFFSAMKTAGLRVLQTAIKNANKKEMSFYSDMKKAERKNAHLADDMRMRKLIHRLHLGETNTAYATLSVRIKAIDRIAPGFFNALTGTPNTTLTDLIKDITSTFTINLDGKSLLDVEGTGKLINLSISSYKANLEGARSYDLVTLGPLFETWSKEALTQVIGKSAFLQELKNSDSIEQLEKALAKKFTKLLVTHKSPAIKMFVQNARAGKKGKATLKQTGKAKPGKRNRQLKTKVNEWQGQKKEKEDALNLASVLSTLNQYINKYVEDNMGKNGRLVYRTGRFANSIFIRNVKRNPVKATLSTEYSYMEYPYRVFEKHETRNPRDLIELSIREIMRQKVVDLIKEPSDIAKSTFRRGERFPYINKSEYKQGRSLNSWEEKDEKLSNI